MTYYYLPTSLNSVYSKEWKQLEHAVAQDSVPAGKAPVARAQAPGATAAP